MSNPLTTPSSVPATTPVPRNPDGSPLPRQRMKAAIERVKKKLGIPEGEPWDFNEAEAAAFFEKRPDIAAKVDSGDIVTVEVQEPKWVNDEEAAKIRADIATATDNQVINPGAVDFSRKMEPGVYTEQGFTPGGSPAGTYTADAVLTDVTVEPGDPQLVKDAVDDAEKAYDAEAQRLKMNEETLRHNPRSPEELEKDIAAMTPQQKRAATLAAKRAAKEAEQNG